MKKRESLYIGIDISSNHIKVAAYNKSGVLKAVASTPTPVHMTKDGGIYHLAEDLKNKTFETVLSCMERIEGSIIKAIGVSSVGESGILLDQNGEPLNPVLAWYDNRPQKYLQRVKETVPKDELFRKTGLIPEARYSLLKCLWMKENLPDVWKQARSWLHIAEYIVYCLTGVMKSEYSLASRSMMFHVNKRQWDDELLQTFGIEASLMQEPVQAGLIHGHVHKTASEITKLPAGTPVTIAGHHPIVGAYGIGGVLDGDVTDVSDMMESLIVTLPEQSLDQFAEAQPFAVGCHVVPDHHYAFLDIGLTGGIVEWFLSITGWDHLKLMNVLDMANEVQPGLSFYPILSENSETDNHMQMGWFGGHLTNSYPEQMAAAMFQGLSCSFRYRIDELRRQLQVPIKRLMIGGEYTKYDYWMQLKADLLDAPIYVCRKWEGSSRGAAVLAAKSIDEIEEFAVPPSMTLTPDASSQADIESFYQNNYLKNIDHLKRMTSI